ncbi:helix-turn-helix domain-containing protein [Oceanobacillus profundus]|uniref:helix-turn-helix domain-containing protein n=1 Tax=Oceanobacillus profundus TaxID=372463 RepID=UPI00203A891D|nr:helix-turn-helix transcriptional regulator [Oceanobacillus profundus]MCM3396825.1 helix-turn-helix domain-containing protein [Oceanobacillus profundus]
MTAFDRLKKLCDEQGISVNTLEERIGLGRNTLYSWKKKTPSGTNLIKVADYFDVQTDFLLGRSDKKRYYDLTEKDERDIEKQLEDIINNVESESGLAAFDGSSLDELDEENREIMIASLKNALRMHKRLAKKKFTPNKYR